MFTFKLQSTLNYRRAIEEKKLLEYSEGKKMLERRKETLKAIQRERAMLLNQLKIMQSESFNIADATVYLSYMGLFQEKEKLQQEVVDKTVREVEAHREALLEAVKNRKIMDTLREQQFQVHKGSIASYERMAADETAVLRFVRKRK